MNYCELELIMKNQLLFLCFFLIYSTNFNAQIDFNFGLNPGMSITGIKDYKELPSSILILPEQSLEITYFESPKNVFCQGTGDTFSLFSACPHYYRNRAIRIGLNFRLYDGQSFEPFWRK